MKKILEVSTFALGSALLLSACGGGRATLGGSCATTAGCGAGLLCVSGKCTRACSDNASCGADARCTTAGVCEAAPGAALGPRITAISGDLATGRIRGGVHVSGERLDTVTVARLVTRALEPVADLVIGSASATTLDLGFTASVAQGDYAIMLEGQGGAARQEVTLLQGEKGDKGDTGAISSTITGSSTATPTLTVENTDAAGIALEVKGKIKLASLPIRLVKVGFTGTSMGSVYCTTDGLAASTPIGIPLAVSMSQSSTDNTGGCTLVANFSRGNPAIPNSGVVTPSAGDGYTCWFVSASVSGGMIVTCLDAAATAP